MRVELHVASGASSPGAKPDRALNLRVEGRIGTDVHEARTRRKALEQENRRLKKIVAE